MSKEAEPTLLPGQIMALAETIDRRSEGVSALVRALSECVSVDEVKLVAAQILFENGCVRSEARQLVLWCRTAKITGILGEHSLPVPAVPNPAVEVAVARPPVARRLAEDLVLIADDEGHEASMRERMLMIESLKRSGDHTLDEEEDG